MSKLRQEWIHQYTVHPPPGIRVHFRSHRNAKRTLLQTCACLSLAGQISEQSAGGLQSTPIQSRAKEFSRSWWKKKMPVGGSGRGKKTRDESQNRRHSLQSLRMKRHLMIGRLSGQLTAEIRGCAGLGGARGGTVVGEVRRASGSGRSPWPRGQSAGVVAACGGPSPRTRRARGLQSVPVSPRGGTPKRVCAVGRERIEGFPHRALGQGRRRSPLLFPRLFPLDVRASPGFCRAWVYCRCSPNSGGGGVPFLFF